MIMEALTLEFVTAACAGQMSGGSPQTTIRRVCTDSRHVEPGDLFIAIKGERMDGHEFLSEAARKGAVAVMTEKQAGRPTLENCARIAVESPRAALGQLAARYRLGFALRLTAVGGSNGKTTTKELAAAVLRQRFATIWSEASFNNDIGVPLTLLNLEKEHEAGVLEVGTNHPGELDPLLKMIRPHYGIITNIGREHLEFFGDVKGVAQEEGRLAEVLPAEGTLFLSGDNEWTERLAERTRANVVRVGFSATNDWRVSELHVDKRGVTFCVAGPQAELAGEYHINLLGRHQAVNALLALALGAHLGLSRGEIQRGFSECKPARMRMQFWELNGVRVLDDAYNANADSMVAALRTLQELPCEGRKVAVLGDMAELGAHSEAAHEEVGRCAAQSGVGQLFAVGKMAAVMARGARDAGLRRVFEFGDVETAAAAVKSFVKSGDILLLKASRATRLERVAEKLRAGEAVRRN
ncbi:UDP-N-acetylmuramoyl-tripeptide--D-alanyl-D-alanine ligase [Verrucomicrobia bacterium]|nr:UDP-N-acetylmuramoyl-tripeptide--D-alanyl-D-alanine ligase [Verrucomicrobiota bacterium]